MLHLRTPEARYFYKLLRILVAAIEIEMSSRSYLIFLELETDFENAIRESDTIVGSGIGFRIFSDKFLILKDLKRS